MGVCKKFSSMVATGSVVFGALAPLGSVAHAWSEVESSTDLGVLLADDLAGKVVPKLKAELSGAVQINTENCKSTIIQCVSFNRRFLSVLSENRIQFIEETDKDGAREKIADELAYQHSTDMVDKDQAVTLGKQIPLRAMLNLSVSERDGEIIAQAQSLSIEAAAVNISEMSAITVKTELSKPLFPSFFAYSLMTVGTVAFFGGTVMAYENSQKANKAHRDYQSALTIREATDSRRDTEAYDKSARNYTVAAAGGIVVALWGLTRASTTRVVVTNYFKFGSRPVYWKAEPFAAERGAGVNVQFGF